MQPNKISRLLRALARQGLDVSYKDRSYSVRWLNSPDAPMAEVLLLEFPVEAKALKQLANLATAKHPDGGCIHRVCATPDFHPGDAGVAIGSILETSGQVIPAAVGSDINCGMRLHVADLSVEQFLAQRDRFVELMKGDFFFGKRDVIMTARTMQAVFQDGVMGWLDAMLDRPTGSFVRSDFELLASESDRIFLNGSMLGHTRWAPEELVPESGLVRDDGLATIGGGNHFVEVQWIDRVENGTLAYQWGVRCGQLAFMIHSGSRHVGKYIGGMWRDRSRTMWRKGLKYPDSRLFPLSSATHPEAVSDYLQADRSCHRCSSKGWNGAISRPYASYSNF
jgi:tRNA-splicing ligase RtcB (3'-phosphate/5'-hydroxy nucleic acid ligase)